VLLKYGVAHRFSDKHETSAFIENNHTIGENQRDSEREKEIQREKGRQMGKKAAHLYAGKNHNSFLFP